MTNDTIIKIVFGVIAGFGGVGGIIILVIKFSVDIIARRLEEKYTLKLNKELEEYKIKLDSKNYITKAKFDAEFSIYRELSKVFFAMVKAITIMIPSGLATYPAGEKEREEYEQRLYITAKEATVIAQDKLNGEAPFIPESLWDKYNDILDLCRLQLNAFENRWNVLYLASSEQKKSFSKEDYMRSREIVEKFELLNNAVRDYTSKLDVLE